MAGAAVTVLFPPSLGRARIGARAEVLAASLSRRLGTSVAVEVARSYAEIERRILDGSIELAWAPPVVCARVEKSSLAILKAVRGGQASSRAAIVCRADDPTELAALAGKRAAWVDPLSTGGFLLAAVELGAAGVDPGSLEARHHGSYQAALLAVLAGDADIASVYVRGDGEQDVERVLEEHVGPRAVGLRVVAMTGEAPPDGLVFTRAARGRPELVDALTPLADGSRGPTLLLELLEADTLERAGPTDYAALRQVQAELGLQP